MAQSPSNIAPKNGFYEDLGEEVTCKGRRNDFQAAFKQLLKELKPKNFGSPDSVKSHLTNENCSRCGDQTATADSLKKLIEVRDEILASEIFNHEHERDIQCVLSAQREFPDRHESKGGFSYADCSPARKSLSQTGASGWRPCRTRENAESMAISLKLVASCTGISESDMFSLLQHEGGFNLNVMSATGAAGIGQLTLGAIEAVKEGSTGDLTVPAYQSIEDAVLENLYQSSVAGVTCDHLRSYVRKFPINPKSDCEVILPPANPIMSLMIAARMFKNSQEHFKKLVEQKISLIESYNEVEKNPFDFEKLFTKDAKDRLIRALMLWSYNGGEGGVSSVFNYFILKTFINRASFDVGKPEPKVQTKIVRGKRITSTVYVYPQRRYSKATIDDLLEGLEISILRNYSSTKPSRRKEVSGYLRKIETGVEKHNRTTAGNCFGALPQPPFVEAANTTEAAAPSDSGTPEEEAKQ